MKDMYDLLSEITGIQIDESNEFKYTLYARQMLENLANSFAHSLDYSQMKKIKLFLDKYPKLESIETTNVFVQMTYIKLKTIFRCRLYRAIHGREARLKRYTGWESLIFRKTEKECTGDNFKKWMEDTFKLLANYTGKELLCGLTVGEEDFDRENYYQVPNIKIIIDAFSIFIWKIDSEEGKQFDSYEGFKSMYSWDAKNQTGTFQNRLNEFKLENLTLKDCLKIQELFDKFYLLDFEYGVIPKDIFDFVDNMVQLRIALEIYGDKTGYKVDK